MPFPTLTIEQERKLQIVNNRIMRREMERNPTRKFFRQKMSPTTTISPGWPKGFGFSAR